MSLFPVFLVFRIVPDGVFIDDSLDYIERIDELLKE